MGLDPGLLRRAHHLALRVQDLSRSRQFYGQVLGLQELQGQAAPATLRELIAAGKVANFQLPDGTILDLFLRGEEDLTERGSSAFDHLAFDIASDQFDLALRVLQQQAIPIEAGPVNRPTGRGIYFRDPDGLLLEIRCDPLP
jgi:glyoxylase I family protein